MKKNGLGRLAALLAAGALLLGGMFISCSSDDDSGGGITPPEGDDTTEIAVESVSISPSGETTIEVGGTVNLTATVTPDNATDKTVSWESSDTSIATVSDSGVVTGIAEGTAEITAKAGDITSDAVTVTVVALGSLEGTIY